MRLHLPSFGTPAASSAASSSSSAAGFAGASTAARGALAALLVFGSSVTNAPSAQALDAAAVGTCVVTQCTAPLARCIVDGSCLANLACIQTCNNRPDEGDCQIKCGDDFSSPAVDQFTKCAVTAKDCVPQRTDDGSWPVPIGDALVKSFDPSTFTGPWYISAGLNKAFDVFDCQLHKFEFQKAAPAKAIKAGGQPQETLPGKLVGDLQWRVKDPVAGTNFVTRKAVQEFWQDAKNPAILYNHDNDFLHYEDDWYILAQKENAYVAVYYRGNNDAWDGYGGAVVYSKDPVLNPKYFPELDAAFQKVGHSWSEFQLTDNTCKARETKLKEFEEDFVFVETRVAGSITSSPLIQEIEKELIAVEREIEKDIKLVETEVVKDVVGIEKEIEKDVVAVEQEIEKDVKSLFGFGKK